MDNELDRWQSKLEAHFSALAAIREPDGHTVFAIEHDLTPLELDDIADRLRKVIRLGVYLSKHWLLWVVYAVEIGYDYDGEEYWPSFERRTKHWAGDAYRRQQLRNWFARFQLTYSGAVPTGAWAQQFSIIAWPVTHALLPKDLQSQLARVLYEHRYAIAESLDATAVQVGHLIAVSSYGASARFRNFVEQEELTGRIVIALLSGQAVDDGDSILPGALKRIIADLELSSEARAWLKEARDVASKARVRLANGANAGRNRHGVLLHDPATRVAAVEAKCLKPKLLLRRESTDTWSAAIEVPSFAGLAALNSQYAAFLRSTRCAVAGTGASWNTKGWLLYSPPRQRLLEWPNPAKAVVRFERFSDAISHLVMSECRTSPGPIWLFRVDEDGTAAEVLGLHIRAGCTYIIVHSHDLLKSEHLAAVQLDCHGVKAHALHVPEKVDESFLRLAKKLELRFTRTLRVWSAGVPALRSDDETSIEWTTDDPHCIGLGHDDTCMRITAQIDGGATAASSSTLGRRTSFLNLGRLGAGVHTLQVVAQYQGASEGLQTVDSVKATFIILVRPPRRWIPGTEAHTGLVVTPDPHELSLDGVLNGRGHLLVSGPKGRQVHCTLKLLGASGDVIAVDDLGDLTIPSSKDDWFDIVREHVERETDPDHYQHASSGRLVVDGGELGRAEIPLRHSVVPLRWKTDTTKGLELRLVDDTAHDHPVELRVATFKMPSTIVRRHTAGQAERVKPDGHGGLYVAVAGPYRASIVACASMRMSLNELREDQPELDSYLEDGESVAALLGWIRDWERAMLVGPLSAQRRSLAVKLLTDQLFASMCGPDWVDAERWFKERPADVERRELLEGLVNHYPAFAIGLSKDAEQMLTSSIEESANHLLGHAIRYRECGDVRLCEAALRLATSPGRFADWAGAPVVRLLNDLVRVNSLVRGARLLVLLTGEGGRQRTDGWYA